MLKYSFVLGMVLIGLSVSVAAPALAADGPYDTWRQYLGRADSSQYSSLKQVNKSNVNKLQVAWTYPVGAGNLLFNPIVVDGTMYVVSNRNAIVALDAATGKEIWSHSNTGVVGSHGINFWESKDKSDRRLLYATGGYLTAINARTGETIMSVPNAQVLAAAVGPVPPEPEESPAENNPAKNNPAPVTPSDI